MKRKFILWLLKMLGHNDNKSIITIEVNADEALRTLKKIEFEISNINKQLNKLPKPTVSVTEITDSTSRVRIKENIRSL